MSDTVDPTEGILSDLEQLRQQSQGRQADADDDDSRRAQLLESIADKAGQKRGAENRADSQPEAAAAPGSVHGDVDEDEGDSDHAQVSGDEDTAHNDEDAEDGAGETAFARGLFSNAAKPEVAGLPVSADSAEVQAAPAFSAQTSDNGDGAEAVPVTAPAGGALLFQQPKAELGVQVDPDWEPEDYDDSEDAQDSEGSDSDDSSHDDSHDGGREGGRRRRRRGGRGRRSKSRDDSDDNDDSHDDSAGSGGSGSEGHGARRSRDDRKHSDDSEHDGRESSSDDSDDDNDGDSRRSRRRTRRRERSSRRASSLESEVTGIRGSSRVEAKRQRRREGRAAGRRRPVITEAEFLARRESVERAMIVREKDGRTQLVVTEDGIAVEHYLSEKRQQSSLIGNVYLGRVQNVLPSMEAAFVDIGKGRNAVLYAGEVNWDALGMDGKPRRIEVALNPGDPVLVQVTKDPVGHKGARLTAQISLPGRFLVYVPGNQMTGISRKLPDSERSRLKTILKEAVPDGSGVIVRTAAEGASEDDLRQDIERLHKRWETIEGKSSSNKVRAPELLYSEPDMMVRIIRDVFNEDFTELVIDGNRMWDVITEYVESVAPDLRDRVSRYEGDDDIFEHYRVSEQIDKALNRKVNLPSGGSLVIDRTEAMTVIDVNTGKFTGSGGSLEETVTKNNLEAAEEVIRQLRLRDIGGIIVVDFIDMVLESNRDLVVRRLVECLGRDRTKHQVAEVTSLGLVQMTRKRIGTGLAEGLAAAGEDLSGRGLMLPGTEPDHSGRQYKSRRKGRDNKDTAHSSNGSSGGKQQSEEDEKRSRESQKAMAAIAKATIRDHDESEVPAEADETAVAHSETAEAAHDNPDNGNAESAKTHGDSAEAAEPGERRTRRRRGTRGGGRRIKSAEASESAEFGADGQTGSDSSSGKDRGSEAKAGAAAGGQAEDISMPTPESEGLLMIGGGSQTRIQKAVQKPEPKVEPAAKKPTPAEPEALTEPKPPILIIGQD